MSDQVPEGLRYTKEHEWARVEDDLIRVGITFYAQDSLGDVVYVELPEPGTKVTRESPFGEIQSPKAVSDLFAPVSGEVVERNDDVVNSPELANEDPYGEGWLVAIRAENMDISSLLNPADYEKLVAELSEDT